jgi:hypothetical protein
MSKDKSTIGNARRELYKAWAKSQDDLMTKKTKPSTWGTVAGGLRELGMDVLADPSSNEIDPDAARERLLLDAQKNYSKDLPPGDAWLRLLNQGKLPADL